MRLSAVKFLRSCGSIVPSPMSKAVLDGVMEELQ
jgi:hypothetical protein